MAQSEVKEAIRLFKEESFDLALVDYQVVMKASDRLEKDGDYAESNDIIARYEDYQEELQSLQMECF